MQSGELKSAAYERLTGRRWTGPRNDGSADPGAIELVPPDGYPAAQPEGLTEKLTELREAAKMATSQPLTFDDIKVGMHLRNTTADVGGVVEYKGPRGWTFAYYDEPDRPYGMLPEDAPGFERDVIGELAHHAAVRKHGNGVSSAELADFTSTLSQLATKRILTVGHADYGTGKLQRFEGLSGADLAREMLEEAADAINYLAMASVRMLALANAMEEA